MGFAVMLMLFFMVKQCHVTSPRGFFLTLRKAIKKNQSVDFDCVWVFLLLISNDLAVSATQEFAPLAVCWSTYPLNKSLPASSAWDGAYKHAPRVEDRNPVNSLYISWLEANRQHQDQEPGGESRNSATILLNNFSVTFLLRQMTG